MFKRSKVGFATVVVGWLALGCSSGSSTSSEHLNGAGGGGAEVDPSEDLAGPTPDALAAFGGVRSCDQSGADCYELQDEALDQCWFDAIDFPEYKCTGVYNDTWPVECLFGHDDECAVYSYKFSGGESLPGVKAACEAAVARDEACGERTVTPACDLAARAERPEVVDNYLCYAESACGQPGVKCGLSGTSALGSELCARVDQACETAVCNPDWEVWLNANAGWWREATITAARACVEEPSCRNIKSCLAAWNEAVLVVPEDAYFYPFESHTTY